MTTWPGRPAKTALVVVLALAGGGIAGPAAPDGWSLSAAVTGELRGITNPNLDPDRTDDFAARASLGIQATAVRASRISTLSITGGISPTVGEDIPDNTIGFLAPNLGANLSMAMNERTSIRARLSGRLISTAFTDQLFGLDEDGNIDPSTATLFTGDAIQATLSGGLGLSWDATARDSFSFGLNATRVDFFDGTTVLVPNTAITFGAGWSRPLTPRLTGRLSTGIGWFTAESTEDPQSVSFNLSAGAGYQVTPRLDLSGGLGFALTRTEETVAAGFRTRNTDFSLTGNLGLSYDGPDDSLSFSLRQGVQPSSLGNLQDTTSLVLSYAHRVNTVSSLGISGRVQVQNAFTAQGIDNDQTLALRISPFYSYQLDADTALRLGYSFDLSDETGDTATSHSVFLSLRRGFDLLK